MFRKLLLLHVLLTSKHEFQVWADATNMWAYATPGGWDCFVYKSFKYCACFVTILWMLGLYECRNHIPLLCIIHQIKNKSFKQIFIDIFKNDLFSRTGLGRKTIFSLFFLPPSRNLLGTPYVVRTLIIPNILKCF